MVWLTGLSGAGKSTIAGCLARALAARGAPCEVLDGDAIRAALGATGFTREDRDRHVRWVGFVASRLERHGVAVVVALVSPYREARAFARRLCRRFVEVHVATPLAECERRDVKGLYARARAGELSGFTGVDDPYEPPLAPELTIDTTGTGPEDAARAILAFVEGGAA